MNPQDRLPALRPIDITPVQHDGVQQYLLHDRSGIARTVVALSPAGCFVLAHLTGQHTCADVQAAFEREAGVRLPIEQIAGLVQALDEALFLQGPRYEQAYARLSADYRAAAARDNRDRYPAAEVLRAELAGMLARGAATPTDGLRGLIAPHLDYERGAPCYADAYAVLAAQATFPQRFVLLGTNHAGRAESVVATSRDFRTPLGTAPVDRAFIDVLSQRCGRDLYEHEFDHAHEHSVELQVHFLQMLAGGRPFEIVPVLCPNPCEPRDCGCEADCAGRQCEADGEADHCAQTAGRSVRADLERFGDALAELLAPDKPTVVIAGADFSHVGQRFGDADPTTPAFLEGIAQADRRLLDHLERRDDGGFVEMLSRTNNATRVCSAGPIYGLLRALPGRPLRVLGYHQAVDFEAETHVTCAAAVIL